MHFSSLNPEPKNPSTRYNSVYNKMLIPWILSDYYKGMSTDEVSDKVVIVSISATSNFDRPLTATALYKSNFN